MHKRILGTAEIDEAAAAGSKPGVIVERASGCARAVPSPLDTRVK
jgi:hypothetical protein